ncbi:MAG TPA: YbaN family protein [Acidimicrobiales bacterium]|nr:YbaN family protein [Acidimicrobiales bacterium]
MTGGAGDARRRTGEDGGAPEGRAGAGGVDRAGAGRADPDGAAPVRRGPVAWLWFAGGWVAVALGSLGVIVPGLPTTVFFIVAAACFARCSPRFEQWVLDLPRIGPMVRDHRAGLGMRRRAKVAAVTTILVVSTVSGVFLIANRAVGLAVVGVGLVGAAYVLFRVPTRERVIARRLPSAPPAEAI